MALTSRTKFGPYEILAPYGADLYEFSGGWPFEAAELPIDEGSGMLAVNYDVDRPVAECIVEIAFVRQEGEYGFTGALNDLGPMIRSHQGWADPEELNRR